MSDDTDALADLVGIGRLVREERLQRRVSQTKLAQMSGVRQSTISRIEAGSMLPSWATFAGLLAALDLQPQVSAVARWSDVDAAAQRLEGLSLEQLCGDLEPWLADISDATAGDAVARTSHGLLRGVPAPVPMAVCGASAAQLLRLPVRPRRVELMTGAGVDDVRQVLHWSMTQLMQPLDPRTLLSLAYPPEVEDVLGWGYLLAKWGSLHCHITIDPRFASLPVCRLRVFDADVPVLALEALRDTDPWVRRVLLRARDAV